MIKKYYKDQHTECNAAVKEFIAFDNNICGSHNEQITNELYNELLNNLQKIRDYGDKDENTRIPILKKWVNNGFNGANLNNKNNNEIIEPDYYNDIATSLANELREPANKNSIIGTYGEELKAAISQFIMPSTRYYEEDGDCCHSGGCSSFECPHCWSHGVCGSECNRCNAGVG